MSTFKYQAFISYAHADKAFAKRLHGDLERFRIDRDVTFETPEGTRPGSLGKFFRDDDELAAAPNLGEAIESALRDAKSLIVVCSPNAVRSRWVSEEIAYFRSLGRDRIFAVVIEGELSRTSAECAIPQNLVADGFEPLAADFRDRRADARRESLARLVAGLCGASFDAIKRRELQRARAAALRNGVLALVALALAGAAGAASWIAWRANGRLTVALEERDGQFGQVNENAITFARTLTNWPTLAAEPAVVLVGGINPSRYDSRASVGTPFWNQCPRNLDDCFVHRANLTIERFDQSVVAVMGDLPPAPLNEDARSKFLAVCPSFVGAPTDPVVAACIGRRHWDENVDPESAFGHASLNFGIDENRGVALSTVDSPAYCGSGGCFLTSQLWLRRSDGRYYSAGEFDNDEFAILVGSTGIVEEVVGTSSGQVGIFSQFTSVQRFRATPTGLQLYLSFAFSEEYPSDLDTPPSLRVCPDLPGAREEGEFSCGSAR